MAVHHAGRMPPSLLERDAVDVSPECRTPSWKSLPVSFRQLVNFTGIGVVMTLGYLVLYAALRETLGAQGANLAAWLVTAIADTSANRRITFGVSGRKGAARAQLEGLLVFGSGMAITSGSLVALDALVASPAQVLELGVLVGANVAAGLLRFLLLRAWVFAPARRPGRVEAAAFPRAPLGGVHLSRESVGAVP
jgi:putative flippase GtrA